jgi:hypothetical protein
MLIAALTLASKFLLDRFERGTIFHILIGNHVGSNSNNKRSISPKRRMRKMLDLYLDLLQFNLHIDEADYFRELSMIKNLVAEKFAQKG